jgi:hypothetical protein
MNTRMNERIIKYSPGLKARVTGEEVVHKSLINAVYKIYSVAFKAFLSSSIT